MIYLDNSATTFYKPNSVINSVNNAMKMYCANPGRSGHNASMRTAEKIFQCRSKVSGFFGLKDENNVIFTSSCTHSLNTVIKGILKPGDHCVISSLEHNSVVRPLEKLKDRNISYSIAKVYFDDNDKTVESFRSCLNERTKLIVCTHASNVFGTRLPVERICALAHEYGILFCLDAAQSAGVIEINIGENNYDFVCCPGHKGLYGPMGIGLLLINTEKLPDTLIEGGTGSLSEERNQPVFTPDRYESGTMNIPGVIGLQKGIEFVEHTGVEKIYKREMTHINTLKGLLYKNKNIIIYPQKNGSTYCLPLLSVSVVDTSSEVVAKYLNDKYGIAVRAGLHCAPLAHEFMNTISNGTVRISPSYFTSDKEIFILANALNNLKKTTQFN